MTATARPASVLVTDLSRALQIGKAAEHIVCAELILLGFNAFLADAGLPYDLIVDLGAGGILRIQVKATLGQYKRKDGRVTAYRFGLRKGRHYQRIPLGSVDAFAFVALNIRRVAYVHASQVLGRDGNTFGLVEFCDDTNERRWGSRTFSKFAQFPPREEPPDTKQCFHCGTDKPASAEFFALNKRCRGGINGICRDCSRSKNTRQSRERRVAKPS